ncbi:MAG: hypothetical protein ACXU8N_12765 [Telluria sp.]
MNAAQSNHEPSGLADLPERMTAFELRLDGVGEELHELTSALRVVQADVIELKSDVFELKGEISAVKADVNAVKGALLDVKRVQQDLVAVVNQHSVTLATHTVLIQQQGELLVEHSAMLKRLAEQIASLQTDVTLLRSTSVTAEKALALRNGVVQWIATTFVIGQIIPVMAHHIGLY